VVRSYGQVERAGGVGDEGLIEKPTNESELKCTRLPFYSGIRVLDIAV
jgi:hypothetical protein